MLVIGSLEVGGAETHLSLILPRLAEWFEVSLFIVSGRGVLMERLDDSEVRVLKPFWKKGRGKQSFLLSGVRNFCSLIEFYFLLWRKKPDVVHFFLPQVYLTAGVVSLFAPVGVRVMSRRSQNRYLSSYPRFIKSMELFLHRRMDAIFANSENIVSELTREEGVDRNKISLIYNGVADIIRLGHDVREEFEISAERRIVSVVANLIPYKGHPDLLRACATVPSSLDWVLLIVGKGKPEVEKELKNLADELGISSKVIFAGSRSDIGDILMSSNIAVLPSHEEGFSNAILEAMSAGLPVVATNVGGNAEAIVDGETGYVVAARDVGAISSRLTELLANRSRAVEMGALGRQRYRSLFTLDKCVAEYRSRYLHLLSGREPSG